MCLKCDGYTDEQIDQALELHILIHGWAVQGVEPATPDGPAGGWAYTQSESDMRQLRSRVAARWCCNSRPTAAMSTV